MLETSRRSPSMECHNSELAAILHRAAMRGRYLDRRVPRLAPASLLEMQGSRYPREPAGKATRDKLPRLTKKQVPERRFQWIGFFRPTASGDSPSAKMITTERSRLSNFPLQFHSLPMVRMWNVCGSPVTKSSRPTYSVKRANAIVTLHHSTAAKKTTPTSIVKARE